MSLTSKDKNKQPLCLVSEPDITSCDTTQAKQEKQEESDDQKKSIIE